MNFEQFSQIFLYILFKGFFNTFIISTGAFLLGLVISSLMVFAQIFIGGMVNRFIDVATRVLRSIPPILMLFLIFYGLKLNNIISAIIGLGIISSSYQLQILRGIVEVVSARQLEAVFSIGLNKWKAFKYVILPQTLLLSIPALLNEFTIVIKDSSIAYAIGVVDMFTTAVNIANARMEYAVPLICIALIYLIICYTISYISNLIHRKIIVLGYGSI